MGRPLRMHETGGYYFVTARCFQGRRLLRPTPHLKKVLGGVLARAAKATNVQVCGYVATSSHVHLLCHSLDGRLSEFMQYFLCNVSKKAGRLVDWTGQFWQRRFAAEPVLDDAALEQRMKYILAHGVKEGLVRKVSEWPALSCLQHLLGEPKRSFPFYEWTRRWQGGKLIEGGGRRWAEEWKTTEELELHPIPLWGRWSVERRKARVRELVAEIEAEGRRAHRKVMGVEKVLETHPHTRPPPLKRRFRPRFHATFRLAGVAFLARYNAFKKDFGAALKKLRDGSTAKVFQFPAYSCTPPIRV